jgi:hypothetical protein
MEKKTTTIPKMMVTFYKRDGVEDQIRPKNKSDVSGGHLRDSSTCQDSQVTHSTFDATTSFLPNLSTELKITPD